MSSALPPQPSPYAPVIDRAPQSVVIADIDMPFGSMVRFIVKWVVASIPALIILWVLFAIFLGILAFLFGGAFHTFFNGTRGSRF